MRSFSFIILTGALASLATRATADYWDQLCCLCDECDFPASGRENLNVDQFGTTCYDQLLDMADTENGSTNGSAECAKQINLHRDRCCNSNFVPIDIAVAPTPAPVVNLPYGDEPLCDLCHDGTFPGLPRTVTAVLYIDGNPTCELLYYMGLHGLIEGHLCNPIQDYLAEGCGCGEYNPNPSPSTPMVSSPTASLPTASLPMMSSPTASPASSPTPEPTVDPTLRPTSTPTRAPTSAPTFQPTSTPTFPPTMAPVLKVSDGTTMTQDTTVVLPTVVHKRSSSSRVSKDEDSYKIGAGRIRGGNRG
jgi:hypothetical protein